MTDLHQRVLELDLKGVSQCLADGADINALDDNGDTALHCIVRWEPTYWDGFSAEEILYDLFDRRPDIEIRDRSGKTAEQLVRARHAEVDAELAELVRQRKTTDFRFVDSADELDPAGILDVKEGGLRQACERFREARAHQAVLRSDPDLNLCDEHGNNGMHFAAEIGDAEDLVRRHKAGGSLTLTSNYGWSPYMVLAQQGHVEAFVALAEHDESWASDLTGQYENILHMAAVNSRAGMAQAILEQVEKLSYAPTMLEALDRGSRTPLYRAIGNIHGEEEAAAVVAVLLEAGADPGREEALTDHKYRTPLMVAAKAGRPSVCKLLVDSGADVNRTDARGRTALEYAIESESAEAVDAVLAGQPDLTRSKVEGWLERMEKKAIAERRETKVRERLNRIAVSLRAYGRGLPQPRSGLLRETTAQPMP